MRGPEVGRGLRASLGQLESDLMRVQASRQRAEAGLAELTKERERVVLRLAEVYLPELGPEAFGDLRRQLPALHRRIESILREKQAELEGIGVRLAERGRERERLASELDALTARIEELAEERDALADRVGRAVAADPRRAELVKVVQQTGVRLEQAERRQTAADRERDEKLPAYEADPLFAYLLRRGYGTPDYRASGLARRLDGWVARKVDFLAQRRSHELLRKVPEVVRRRLEESQRALAGLRASIQELEKEIEDLHGLTRVVAQGEALYATRQERLERIEAADAEIQEGTARLRALETAGGQYYEQARGTLVEFLESHPLPQLQQLATGTATPQDDELAAVLARWETEWESARRGVHELTREEQALATRLEALRKIESRFRGHDYDASNSSFGRGFDIGSLLHEFLRGALATPALWQAIVQGQRFEPTRFQAALPALEIILREVARQASRGGWASAGRRGRGGRSRSTGGFGGFGGGSRTSGGFG